jgi:hypothetical protein
MNSSAFVIIPNSVKNLVYNIKVNEGEHLDTVFHDPFDVLYKRLYSIPINKRGYISFEHESNEYIKYCDYARWHNDQKLLFSFIEVINQTPKVKAFASYETNDSILNEGTHMKYINTFKNIKLCLNNSRNFEIAVCGEFKAGQQYTIHTKTYNFLDVLNAMFVYSV